MSHSHSIIRVLAAAGLLWAGSSALAASADEETVLLVQAAYARSVAPGEQADGHRELLAAVLQRVKRSHATDVDLAAFAEVAIAQLAPLAGSNGDPTEVFKKAINAALRHLDPHSRYVDPRTQGHERGDSSGAFGGLGLEVQASDGLVRVVAPTPGSPAERAGLAAGDLIVRVDTTPLQGVPLDEAISLMRGEPGTPVSITVRRGTANEFTVSLTRDTIRRQLLRWSLEGQVLVLRLASFSGAASASMAQAVQEATAVRPPQAVVLDLRGNPGGLLREGVRIADAFLSEGEIVSLAGSAGARQRTWNADTEELLAGLPMVVVIDQRSASAAELVADALQHHGRATVMGHRSYGKGSVQTIYPLGEQKGALRLTTAIYHGPSGRTVHKAGVVPDIELLASTANEGAQPPPATKSKTRIDPIGCAVAPVSDPAISCAVAYLRAGSLDAFTAGLRR